MGKIAPPRLSWRLIFLGATLSSTSALGTAAFVLPMLGIEAAQESLITAFLIVAIIFFATAISKIMQRKSAQYYFAGGAFFAANLVAFLYFLLIPVFFVNPIWTLGGALVTALLVICTLLNAKMAQQYFLQSAKNISPHIITSKNGVCGIRIDEFASSPSMSNAPNIFNFEPQWLSRGLAASAVGAMIFGLNFRKSFPELSIFIVGCGVVYIGSYMTQWFVIAFHKIRLIRQLEKKHGRPLVAIDGPVSFRVKSRP